MLYDLSYVDAMRTWLKNSAKDKRHIDADTSQEPVTIIQVRSRPGKMQRIQEQYNDYSEKSKT